MARGRIGLLLAVVGGAGLVAVKRRRPQGTSTRAVTINLPPDEVSARWAELHGEQAIAARFAEAPGGRGTELVREARGRSTRELEDELRRFKQLVEAGEIARSDSSAGGESLLSQLMQRAAQPVATR